MQLQRPFVVIDLETTGTWIEKDKIIEIGMVKKLPSGEKVTFLRRINPQMPIPPEVVELTGICDLDLKDLPPFKESVQEVLDFIGDADLGGYNLERFDLPLLEREIRDAGHIFDWRKRAIYDAQTVYHYHEKRDLCAAYKFYCNKDLLGAHSALADTEATFEILETQVLKYGQGDRSLELLQKFAYRPRREFFDEGRKFRWWNGELYMMFGKYACKKSLREVARIDPAYLEWILTKDFSDDIKVLVENALAGQFPSCP